MQTLSCMTCILACQINFVMSCNAATHVTEAHRHRDCCWFRAGNPAKKVPVLEIVCTLFRVYFQLNTLRLCKNLIAAVERLDFIMFPASARVTYKYYVGRLCIFDDQYVSLPISLVESVYLAMKPENCPAIRRN